MKMEPTIESAILKTQRKLPTVARMTLGIVVLGLVWRVVLYAMGHPIWGDEAFVAINFVVRDYAGMVKPLVYGQIAPLVFMWVELAFTQAFGLSEWAMRLLPFLAGIAGIFVFWRLARSVLPRSSAHLAIAVFAASYYVTRHTAEVKPYATDLLLAMLLTMAGLAVLKNQRSFSRWMGLVLLAGGAVWCSYTSVFISGAVAVVLGMRLLKSRPGVGVWTGYVAFILLLCGSAAAMYVIYAHPHAEAASAMRLNWAKAFPPLAEPWKLPLWFFAIHTGPMFAYPQGGKPPASIATFILFIIGAVRIWRTNRDLFWLLLLPFGLTFVAACLKAYPYGGAERVSQYLGPAICLLMGTGWSVVMRRVLPTARKFREGLVISTIGLALFPIGGTIMAVAKPYKNITVKREYDVVRNSSKQSSPADQWIVFNADRPVDYAPYLGDWRGMGGQFVFNVLRFAPQPPTFAPPADKVVRRGRETIWFFVFHTMRKGVVFPEEKLAAYVATLKKNLGEPRQERFHPKGSKYPAEYIDVYRFPPRQE